MSITKDVLSIIRNNPMITAGEIQECAKISIPTAKAILWRLTNSGKVNRTMVKRPAPKGPQSVYAYYIEVNDGIQEETREEINAEQITSASQTDGSSSPRSEVRQEGGYPPIYR